MWLVRLQNDTTAQYVRVNDTLSLFRTMINVHRKAMPILYLIATVLYLVSDFLPAQAAPRTGPDRPFTGDWHVAVPPAPHVRSIMFVPGTQSGVALVNDGTILRTEDEGKSWKRATTPPDVKTALRAVIFTGATTGVAVGHGGTILRTEDGGKHW